MSFSRSACIRLGALTLCASLAACEGSSSSNVTDGGFDRPQGIDGGGGRDTGPRLPDDGGIGGAEARPLQPPPPINPSGSKLLPNGWDMLGTHGTGCSHGMPSRVAGAPRWCAVSRTGTTLGSREIWVINVTAAAAAPNTVKCDGTSPSCIKLNEALFSARPNQGPRYPASHRFFGETLVFYAGARSAAGDLFRGTAYAWQPGWPAAKAISSNNASLCSAHNRAPLGWCLENVDGLMEGQVLKWDEHVGDINNGPMNKIATFYPEHPDTQGSQADSAFTTMGDYFLYSTPTTGATVAPESLYFVRTADIKPGMPVTGTKVGDNISQWTVSADGTKWIFLRDYNYNTQGQPSGTLTMSDFPTGANERKIEGPRIPSGNLNGVAAYRLLADEMGMGNQIGFLAEVKAGKGDYRILTNPADPNAVVNVVSGTIGLPLPSQNLQYSYYATSRAMDIATTDSKLVRNDGTQSCSLTNSDSSALFGFPFTKSATMAFWMDNYDQATDSGEGWVAKPDCTTKMMFSRNIDYWFINNDDGLLYSDEGDGSTAALKWRTITAGTLGAPQDIQKQAGRTFWILPNFEGVLYSITSTQEAANGIYFAKLPPVAGPAVDAGGADAAPADAGAGN